MSLGRSAGLSDTGRRRRHNEDSYVCEPPLFAIADGMGGAQAGEVASGLAAAVLNETALEEANGEELSREAWIAELIQEANRRVFLRSSEDSATSGMGTTMTVALVDADGGTVAIGHVGDSRAYRVRETELEQLTEDHSLVNELLKSGKLSPEEAEHHPQRSVVTRAVGTESDVDVDTFTVDARPGDLFLLCSDGLTDMLSDDEILGLVQGSDLDETLRDLVQAANKSGGDDNITVVAFEIAVAESGAAIEETARMAAPTQVEPTVDDEDTLSGLEPVPAVDTAVVSAAEVEQHLAAEAEEEEPQEQNEQEEPDEPEEPEEPEEPDEPEAEEAEETEAEETEEAVVPRRRPEPHRRVLPLLLLLLLLCAIAVLVVWGLYR